MKEQNSEIEILKMQIKKLQAENLKLNSLLKLKEDFSELKINSVPKKLRLRIIEIFEKYRLVFEKVPIGLIFFDNNLKIIEVNDNALITFQTKRKKLINFDISTIVDDRILKAFKSAISGHEGFYEGEYITTTSGVKVSILLNTKPHFFRQKGELISGGIAMIEDITDKRIFQIAIDNSIKSFHEIIDNLDSIIYVVDSETSKILLMNRSAISLYGDSIGKDCCKTFFSDKISDSPCEICPANKAINNPANKKKYFEKEYFNKNENRWYKTSITQIEWINGIKAILTTSTDITVIKQAHLKIQEQNYDLENQTSELESIILKVMEQNLQINEQAEELKVTSFTKDKMFSIIGHDLRGPVGNIKNVLDILIEEYEKYSKEEIREFVEPARDSAGTAYNLLANLLYWAKNQIGKMNFNPEFIEIDEIIEENVSLFASNLERKRIKFTYNPTENFEIFVDENMAKTIIRNLISNAIKFTPENGEIIILTKQIKIKDELFLEISVSDNGIGISTKNIDKIFDKNIHFTTYGTDNEKGSGLGMILVKDFTERHGGTIRIESKENFGTKFIFTLPCEEN